jgi:DNA repair protein RadC
VKISQGTLDTLLVHPREVFKPAIAANAAAIVLVHNHPSGDPTPSEADIKVTRDLIRAGQLLKIEVLDHIIIGRKTQERPKDYSSLRELGYFYT